MKRNVDIDLIKMSKDDALHMETVQMSVDEARAFVAGEELEMDDLDTSLDLAQGAVFTDEKEVAYVIIKIVK